jgi:hypothetical protein|tara:strand:+ start:2252 stop:2824 length:573 start_codon:yes stop_codon:yes gene_type:complete
MQENVKRDIIGVIRNSISAIKKQDLTKLRSQSNRTVHNSSIYQDKYSISISVIIYTILKILEKNTHKRTKELQKSEKLIINELKNAEKAIRKEEDYNFSKALKKIIFILKKLDKDTGLFMHKALKTSKVKKAYGLYRHGVSSGKSAELLGITKWDLQPYLGATRESEQSFNISGTVEERIKITKELFNIR